MHYLIIVLACVSLTSCASRQAAEVGASIDSECRKQASEYLRQNVIDRLWRDHEYHRQYRDCVSRQNRA